MTSATLDNMIASLDHEDTVAVEKDSGVIEGMELMPETEAEIEKLEFKSLKGIAGRPLNLDDIRSERLNL